MNENTDMVDSFMTAIKRILTNIGGVGMLAAFFCCLFAPAIGGFIQSRMMHNPDGSFIPMSQMPDVYTRMVLVRIGLWLICIAAWSAVILLNLYWKY